MTTRPPSNDLSYRRWLAYILEEGNNLETRRCRLVEAPEVMRENLKQEIVWIWQKRKADSERSAAGAIKKGNNNLPKQRGGGVPP